MASIFVLRLSRPVPPLHLLGNGEGILYHFERVTLFFGIGFILSGCGVDIISKLISNEVKDGPQMAAAPVCPQAVNGKTFALELSGQSKVDLGGTAGVSPFSYEQIVREGTELIITYKPECVDKPGIKEWVLDRDYSLSELEAAANNSPCVAKVDRNFIYRTSSLPSDPSVSMQRHFNSIRASAAYDVFYDPTEGLQQDIVIAVIDSGVDIDHKDLKANIWSNLNEVPGNGIDDDQNGFIDDVEGWNFAAKSGQAPNNPRPITWTDAPGGEAHGTHVAGLIAATWNNEEGGAGVMGDHAKIMAINVFGDSSGGRTTRLNQGIRYAADNHADVINLSVGACGLDRTTYDAIMYAICKGATVVTAAGNVFYQTGLKNVGRELSDSISDSKPADSNDCNQIDVPDGGPKKFFLTPASFGSSVNGLITVGASNDIPNAEGEHEKSDFSAWGTKTVEISAPGSEGLSGGLYSTSLNDSYSRQKGTSMATPVVSAAVALTKAYMSRKGVAITPMNIEAIIKNSGRVEALLVPYVLDGKHLDLLNLANEIDLNFNSYR